MATDGRVLLEKNGMKGKEHSLMGVLPHPFLIQIGLQQLWVANISLAFTSTEECSGTVAQGLRLGLSRISHSQQCASG